MQACLHSAQLPFTMELRGLSALEPVQIAMLLPAAILNCGGWIPERAEPENGVVTFLLEFECERALEVYGALVALGIQLSRNAHLTLTRLCECARHGNCMRLRPVARIRMTLQAASDSRSAEMPAAISWAR